MYRRYYWRAGASSCDDAQCLGLLHFMESTRKDFPGDSDSEQSACNAGDMGSILGSGRPPGEGKGYSSVLAWRIPWTEEPGGLQSVGSQSPT